MSYYRINSVFYLLCIVCAGYSLQTEASTALYAEAIGSLQGKLEQPSDVAISDSGNAYVLDGVNNRVVVFDDNGKRMFVFDAGDSGRGKLNMPMGITIAAERIYVADSGNHRIVLFDLHGKFIKSLSLSAPLSTRIPPEPVSLSVTDGVITWSDRRNHRVCLTDASKGKTLQCWGKRGEGKSEFQFPFQLGVDRDGYLHVVDVLNGRVQVFNPQGRRFAQVARFGLDAGELYRPNGLAFYRGDELLVSDVYRGTVSVYRHGRFVTLLKDKRGRTLHFGAPVALTVWRKRLYVVDALQNRIEVFRLHSKELVQTAMTTDKKRTFSRKNCITCHLAWAENYTASEGEQDGVPPVATPRMCYSCHHGAVIDSRRTIGRGEQHPDMHHQRKDKKAEQEKERKDKIPESFPLLTDKNGKKQLSCGSCHTPHTADTENAISLHAGHANPWLRVLNNDADLCQQCHESKLDSSLDKKHPIRGINHPVGIFLKPPPTLNAKGYATNKKLHRGLPAAMKKNGAMLGRQQQLVCQSCHQIHGGSEKSLSVLPVKNGELCKQCHPRQYARNEKEARKKGIHPVNFDLEEPVKMGKERIKRVTCLSCHSLHAGKEGTPLLKYEYRNGKLCSYCHEDQDVVVNSDHDLRITAKESKNRFGATPKQAGVCGSCHTLHQGEAKTSFLFAGELHVYTGKQPVLERDKLCLSCHRKKGLAEKKVVKRYSHPAEDLVLRSDPAVMPLINKQDEIKEFGAIACVTCHEPHRWQAAKMKTTGQEAGVLPGKPKNREGNVLNSFLRRKGVKNTFCIDCHGLEARVKYKYYHDEFTHDKGVNYIK